MNKLIITLLAICFVTVSCHAEDAPKKAKAEVLPNTLSSKRGCSVGDKRGKPIKFKKRHQQKAKPKPLETPVEEQS